MNLISAHIPAPWLGLLWLGCGLLFLLMWRRASWAMLTREGNLNILLGATVALLLIWLIKAGVKPGLDFHLLGATVLTLMFRPWFALLSLALLCLAIAAQTGEYHAFPGNLLTMGVVPVLVSWGVYRFVDSRLPNHMFIYIFLNAFFGAALAIGAVGLVSTAFAALAGVYPLAYLFEEYLPFYLLMAWAEAFATGMMITLLVVYRPDWVATFDDRRYLLDK
jgi:uncharacterized membrane protein